MFYLDMTKKTCPFNSTKLISYTKKTNTKSITETTMNTNLRCAIKHNTGIPSEELTQEANKHLNTINSTLNTFTKNLNEIQRKIDNLKTLKEDLLLQISHKTKEQYQIHSLFSPYRKIPPELIAKIFLETILNHNHNTRLYEWLDTLDIFLNTCLYWQKIALVEPNIWKYLSLVISSSDFKKAYLVLQNWLPRLRKEFKLDIRFTYSAPISNIQKIYNLLQNSNHLTDLSLMMLTTHIEEHINALAQVLLPKVHTLKINEEPSSFNPLEEKRHKLFRPQTSYI